MKLQGSFVALVTPYLKGEVDLKKVKDLVDFHLKNGTSGICPIATTGEGPVLTHDEKADIIRAVVETARGKALVFPGTGTYNTRESIEQTKVAKELGADGALMVTPYYNKPTQEGQYQHFKAIAEAANKPIILYNVPGRTAANIEPVTIGRLAEIPNIAGVKEASGNLTQVAEICSAARPEFSVLSGDDAMTLPVIAVGGVGVISVASNEIPHEMAELTRAGLDNNWDKARQIFRKYLPLMQGNFIESSPMPLKAVLAQQQGHAGRHPAK